MASTKPPDSNSDRKKRFWELAESVSVEDASTTSDNTNNPLIYYKDKDRKCKNDLIYKFISRESVVAPNEPKKEKDNRKLSFINHKINKIGIKDEEPGKNEKEKAVDKNLSKICENLTTKPTIKEFPTQSRKNDIRNDKERFSSKTSTYNALGLYELRSVNKGITGVKVQDNKEHVIEIRAGDIPKKKEESHKEKKQPDLKIKPNVQQPQVKKYTAVKLTNNNPIPEPTPSKPAIRNTLVNDIYQKEKKTRNSVLLTEPVSPNSPLFSYSPKSKVTIFNNTINSITLDKIECFKNIKENFSNKMEQKKEKPNFEFSMKNMKENQNNKNIIEESSSNSSSKNIDKSHSTTSFKGECKISEELKQTIKTEENKEESISIKKEYNVNDIKTTNNSFKSKDDSLSFKSNKETNQNRESIIKNNEENIFNKSTIENVSIRDNGIRDYKNIDNYEEISLSTLSTSTVNLYSPGKLLKDAPKLKILHIEYTSEDIFLIIKVNNWMIRKNFDLIKRFIKPNEAICYDPNKNKINKEIIEINLNSKLIKDIPSLQSFILTDLIDTYNYRNDYLLMNDNGWIKVKIVKINDKFILYKDNEVYRMFTKNELDLEIINTLVFKLYFSKHVITLGVNSNEEMNEWIEFITN